MSRDLVFLENEDRKVIEPINNGLIYNFVKVDEADGIPDPNANDGATGQADDGAMVQANDSSVSLTKTESVLVESDDSADNFYEANGEVNDMAEYESDGDQNETVEEAALRRSSRIAQIRSQNANLSFAINAEPLADPIDVKDAMARADAARWKATMQEEMDSL